MLYPILNRRDQLPGTFRFDLAVIKLFFKGGALWFTQITAEHITLILRKEK